MRPFPSIFERHCESEAPCIVFIVKISFHSYANYKTTFHFKSFARSLALMRFKATRKWPIPCLLDITVKFENNRKKIPRYSQRTARA